MKAHRKNPAEGKARRGTALREPRSYEITPTWLPLEAPSTRGYASRRSTPSRFAAASYGDSRPKAYTRGADHIPPPPTRCSGTLHRVQAGETLFTLAMAHGLTVEALLAVNPQITNPDELVAGQVVCIPERTESMSEILNTLLLAEKVETALYAAGLMSPVLQGLPEDDRAYFQAALSHEIAHVNALTSLGASAPFNEFFFPPGALQDRTIYLNTLLTLETAGIAAYIQASDEFARMGRFDLARLMDQIMGVEAEHRALTRDVLELVPADNLCFERAPKQPVTVILAALPSFVRPNQFDGASVGPIPLPTPETAAELIGPFGCANPTPDL